MSDVVLLPSLGRPASDFDALVGALGAAGHRCLALDPAPAAGWPGEPTLHDLAADVVARAAAAGLERFHLVGHAFGNRLARTVTADHGDRVLGLTLLAAGGHVTMAPDVARSLVACFDETLSAEEHLEHVRRAFFAPGNDAALWTGGWMGDVARYQRGAVERTPPGDWWDAVAPRVLVVQGLDDAVAPPGNGRRYVADHPDVARLVEIAGAGHALLPERPAEIAAAVVGFLADA